MPAGYYRHPTIHQDNLVYVSEDDLWQVSSRGGTARRLTSGLGAAAFPTLSPDGKWLAFSNQDEGHTEIYVMPSQGGESKRLTFLGAISMAVGWSTKGKIIFASNTARPFHSNFHLYSISPEGGTAELLPTGPAMRISYGPRGASVIGRNAVDPARWKRYRGGTAGDIWIDTAGKGNYKRLLKLDGNLSRPLWIGKRIYFLSDHEGTGNLYSTLPNGKDLKRHTDQDKYYVRNPSTDGRNIVYHAGADIFVYNVEKDRNRQIEIQYHSPRTQRNRKFVAAAKYLESCSLHPRGHLLALTSRGKIFHMGNWEGPVVQQGASDGIRYVLASWLNDGKRLITVSDAGGEEHLEIHHTTAHGRIKSFPNIDIGEVSRLKVSPVKDQVLLSNHRNELILVDLKKGTSKVLDRCDKGRIQNFDWSPDGRWIAYSAPVTFHTSAIRIYDIEHKRATTVTKPVLYDVSPCFDPEGKYLYFLSYRVFDPVYDTLHFDLSFPRGVRPYLITLQKGTPSPFLPQPEPFEEEAETKTDGKLRDKKRTGKKKNIRVKIDFDNIKNRLLAFPVPEGRYAQIAAAHNKVFFSRLPIEGSLNRNLWDRTPTAKAVLYSFDFETQQMEKFLAGISNFTIGTQHKLLACRIGNKLRILKTDTAPDKTTGRQIYSKKGGWINLGRIKVSVDPAAEWRQMFDEAWRLQRNHFWTENMSNVDWQKAYKRYLPLLDRIATRAEFSDLMWEMQGELGTSHAYEIGGDYRTGPNYNIGFLGADFQFNSKCKAWRIKHIVDGDTWDEKYSSPLSRPGIKTKAGDTLLAVNGRKLGKTLSPLQALVNQAGAEVELLLGDRQGKAKHTVSVKTLSEEIPLRYRAWVENNREIVHKKSRGRIGYVHIPNMGPLGYAEFHRYFLAETDREGLIVDVRYNGGGHVSQLILEKLARRRIAYVQARWFGTMPFPRDSIPGPMIALTNEYAGSDGDIFSHCFKLLKLGPLVGKRTWGGVIGISPSKFLVDGGIATQPEYSFWFQDVGWQVENFGTEPDIEVEIRPQDYVAGKDPQLERTLKEITTMLKSSPPLKPKMDGRPNLSPPKLPKRKK
ncbi:S41 family peptidase [Planctomycetota bacterium]